MITIYFIVTNIAQLEFNQTNLMDVLMGYLVGGLDLSLMFACPEKPHHAAITKSKEEILAVISIRINKKY